MRDRIFLLLITLIILLSPICSAAHYIVGYVENAKDGTAANDHTIVLWNSTIGAQENLSDIIGPLGNSGENNSYSIDCELLQTPCVEGDILTLRVINNGDDYLSEEKNVTVGPTSQDNVDNITLNSPPTTSLIFPISNANLSYSQINFNCSIEDLDENLKEISLYGNWTGQWEINETKQISLGERFKIFTKNISEGFYRYACRVTDNLLISKFSTQNNSFNIDLTEPVIDSILGNITQSCGELEKIRINCTTYDEFLKLDQVIIQSISPSNNIENYTSLLLTGDTYYYDILLNEIGEWEFKCISNDSAGNVNEISLKGIKTYSDSSDFFINSSKINLSKLNPLENEEVKIEALVENNGCTDAQNVLISFFDGDPYSSGINIGNKTININKLDYTETNLSWNAKVGPTNIFIVADYNNSFAEDNESNNKGNRTFSINSWQEIYGNTSVDKIIGGENINIKKWFNESYLEGNIFVTDSEAYINWMELQSIGKTKEGLDSSNDFMEIDLILGMSLFEDSVSNIFSENQNPKETSEILVYQKEINEVPIINSTINSKFITGLLWDSSDDLVDGEFDDEDKEDIVFVAPIKKNTEGNYGIYDYEIKIPSRLREYNTLNTQEVYLYYDLN